MTGSLEIILIMIIVVIFALFVVLFFIPSEAKSSRKNKKKKVKLEEQKSPDDLQAQWQQKIDRLEHALESMRRKNEELDNHEKTLGKELVIEKAKFEKLQEKFRQERGWQEKEQNDFLRKLEKMEELKKELIAVQNSYSSEHALNLKLERELKEQREKMALVLEEKLKVEASHAQLDATMQNLRQEMAQVKRDYQQLKKKHEDTSWIAKSEYVKIEQTLKEKEKELERFRRDVKKELG